MFFIGGISNQEKKLDFVQNMICPKCESFCRMEVYMSYMYFSLFFIPLFKWSKKYYVRNTCCNSIYLLDESIGSKILKGEDITITDNDLELLSNISQNINKCNQCGYIGQSDFEYCPKCGNKL